jgi:hypothetical protein
MRDDIKTSCQSQMWKSQVPSIKFQIITNDKIQNSKGASVLEFGILSLEFICDLGFAWYLVV